MFMETYGGIMTVKATVTVIAPPICSIFTAPGRLDQSGDLYRFRVNEYYKALSKPASEKPNSKTDSIQRPEIALKKCLRHEAEYVGGVGLSYCVCRVEEIQVIGMACWSKEMIRQEQQHYQRSLASAPSQPREKSSSLTKLSLIR
jgi:hypothetical protein